MSEVNHIPTPWGFHKNPSSKRPACCTIYGGEYSTVIARHVRPDDAALIVKSVNNFERMKEALLSAAGFVEDAASELHTANDWLKKHDALIKELTEDNA